MNNEHKHVFPITGGGCWCGAMPCRWWGIDDAKDVPYFCHEPAIDGTERCSRHQGLVEGSIARIASSPFDWL